ncbi:hypothetical protein KKG51_00485 [Patescibacteria group bacterium]|nr:hypothetical protein [Patescibacteria group bacterium]
MALTLKPRMLRKALKLFIVMTASSRMCTRAIPGFFNSGVNKRGFLWYNATMGEKYKPRIEGKEEAPKDENLEAVLRTAKKRAGFTRRYIANREKITGKSINDYVGTIKKLGVDVNPDDDRSLVEGVYKAQEQLGFPKTANASGCDGMFGPRTLGALNSYLDKKSEPVGKQALAKTVPKPQASPDSRPPEAITGGLVIAKNNLPKGTKYDPSQVATMGDSYGVGFFIAGKKKGFEKGNVKTGRKLASIKEGDTKSTEYYALQACEDPSVEVINLLGGRNDMYILTNQTGSNHKSVANRVVASFNRIIDAAHKNGKKVVVYTINYKRVKTVTDRESGIRKGLDIVNAGLMASKADVIIDQRNVNPSLIAGDGLHMKNYSPLVAALQQATGMA